MTTPDQTADAARNAKLAAQLDAELHKTIWIVMAHLDMYGVFGSDPVSSFPQACFEYASLTDGKFPARAFEFPARVLEMNLARGTLRDVTEDVEAALAARRGAL